MTNDEMKAKLDLLESQAVGKNAFSEGGRIVRSGLRNVDCVYAGVIGAIFENKDSKLVFLPFNRGRSFASDLEVRQVFVPEIAQWMVQRDASLDATQKERVIDFIPSWLETRPSSPENFEKITRFNALKKELEEKGLI
jgi:hypothetical protein